ncbi:DUF2062 domain-containing protein [bacterium]|nr:DUF2062 domain-containing protein [bacterium]
MSAVTKVLLVIPTYNNRATLRGVVERALRIGPTVLVVNDGCTDGGPDTLEGLGIARIDFPENRGKGAAILAAGRWAEERGFSHLVTIDADGQHDPADTPAVLRKIEEKPWAIVVGNRRFVGRDVPGSSRFGRVWSNLWLRIASGSTVADSQCGFRAYPIAALTRLRYSSCRYDFEVEVLIRAAWAGLALDSVDVSVHYPPREERVSHFDSFRDNARISRVYALSTMRALAPWPHRVRFRTPETENRLSWRRPLRSIKQLLRERTSPGEMALAVMLGIIAGALPIFGLHSVAILLLATLFRLNRVIAFNSQHLCMPPFVPALCIEIGYYLRHGEFLTELSLRTLGHEAHLRLLEWLIGSLILGPALALVAGGTVYLLAWSFQRGMRARREATSLD